MPENDCTVDQDGRNKSTTSSSLGYEEHEGKNIKIGTAYDLIIFEENLTAEGLDSIIKESKTWPALAMNRKDYDLVYEQHQRFKRLELACRKKAKELEKEEKARSKTHINKIKKDLGFVQDILNPLILRLESSRKRYDDENEAYKEKRARDAAEVQRAEHERQELIRSEHAAYEEDSLFDAKREHNKKVLEIEAERKRLIVERYEFECEKSRLGFDGAWSYAHDTEIVNVNGHELEVHQDETADEILKKVEQTHKTTSHPYPEQVSEEKEKQDAAFKINIIDKSDKFVSFLGQELKKHPKDADLDCFFSEVFSAKLRFNKSINLK